jgi:mannose-6-phosphate isomerase-like protein (cupin superfamily)
MKPKTVRPAGTCTDPRVLRPKQVIGPSGAIMKSDSLRIDEHVGNASTGSPGISIAHVRTNGPCDEHTQTPQFDEYVLVLRGRMVVTVDNALTVSANAGETLWLPKGRRYHYSFPATEGTEYVPVCLPAFSPEIAGRE